MIELLQNRGWIKDGACSKCGTQSWINPAYGDVVVKTKVAGTAFKIERNGTTIVPLVAWTLLEDKLNEL